MNIRVDDLQGPEIFALLSEHLQHMRSVSPPESVHALDINALRQPGITFWTAWDGSELMGCAALKELSSNQVELKSMRTASGYLRRGVALGLLKHLLSVAKARGYKQVSLETGSMAAFEPARQLYSQIGFAKCGPFSDYWDDPNSYFMTLKLID